MKKVLSVLIFSLLVLKSFADWNMMFCDSVDAQNNCVGKSASFSLSGAEVKLTVVLQNADGMHTNKIYFEVYSMDPATYAEDLTATEETPTEATQKQTYHSLTISKKGHYLIKARDAFKDYITSREVEVK